jgi:hypothetical protein
VILEEDKIELLLNAKALLKDFKRWIPIMPKHTKRSWINFWRHNS